MTILHIYNENDPASAHYVAMLTDAVGTRATMLSATNARQFDELCSTRHPDIVHLHAMPPFTLPPGHRLVLTPHGQTIAAFVESYAIVARSPLEYQRLKPHFKRLETVRNPLITRTTTPEACAREMLAIYRRVMDSNVLELMNDSTRQLLPLALAAAIGGDRRWALSEEERVDTTDVDFRQLYIYAEHEGVLTQLHEGLRLLGVNAPQHQPVSCYLPTNYRQPKPIDGNGITPAEHLIQLLNDVQQHGPSLLRLTEMSTALHNDKLDEAELMRLCDEQQLRPLLASTLQLLSEQVLLTEGFMTCPPVDDRQTALLRTQLAEKQKI